MENPLQQPPSPLNISENLAMPKHRDNRSPSVETYRRREHSPPPRHRRSRSHQRRSRYSRSPSRSRSPSARLGSSRRRSRSRSSDRRRKVEHPAKSRCLGVFGLNIQTTKDQIVQIFSRFGPIERVQVVIDAKSGRSRGYCFVYFDNTDDARVAKDQCTGMTLDGRKIRVDYSITQRAHTPTPGVYKGQKSRLDSEHYSSSLRSSHHRDDDRDHRDRDRDRSYAAADEYYYRRRRSSRERRSHSRYSRERRPRHARSYSRSYSPDRRYR